MSVSSSGRPLIVTAPPYQSSKIESSTPDPSAIKRVLVARLASTKGQQSASECLEESKVYLVGDELQFWTNLSKTMLPVVINAEAERLMKATLAEYHVSGMRISLLPAPKTAAIGQDPKKTSAKQETTKQVGDSFTRLSHTASQLNSISDLLSAQVSQIEAALKRLNLGVTAWVSVKYEEDVDGNCYEEHVGYAKIGNRWCVALRTTSAMYGDSGEPDITVWPFIDAPRQVRIRAAQSLSKLIEALCKEADEMIDQLTPRVEELIQLATALSLTGGSRS